MHNYLQQFQQACLEASTMALILSGVVITFFGLFLWLGGARYAGFVVGLLGAGIGTLIGGAAASFMNINPLAAMAICAVLFAITSILLKKIIIVILAIIIFSILSLTGYLGYAFDWSAQHANTDSHLTETVNEVNNRIQSFQNSAPDEKIDQFLDMSTETQQKVQSFWGKIREIFYNMKPSLTQNTLTLILICLAGALIGFILAKLLKTLVMSLCCSIVGSTSIILGVLLLVFAKGIAAIDAVNKHPKFMPTLFGIMVIIGWLIQIIITGSNKKKIVKSAENTEDQ